MVARKLDDSGTIIVYANKGGAVIACGIALHGVASGRLEKQVLRRIQADMRFRRQPVEQTPAVEGRAFRHVEYWGDPHAPTMIAVFILTDPSTPAVPTFVVDYHATLIR